MTQDILIFVIIVAQLYREIVSRDWGAGGVDFGIFLDFQYLNLD
jgi:hypothetical protein